MWIYKLSDNLHFLQLSNSNKYDLVKKQSCPGYIKVPMSKGLQKGQKARLESAFHIVLGNDMGW